MEETTGCVNIYINGVKRQKSFRSANDEHIPGISNVSVEKVRARAMQAVEYYNNAVLTGDTPNGSTGAYRSLGDVFGTKNSFKTPRTNGVKQARSVTNVSSDRTFSIPESSGGYKRRVPLNRFGHPDMRASYSERSRQRQQVKGGPPPVVYKSNGSLEMDEDYTDTHLRREFGSHGSIDVITSYQFDSVSTDGSVGGPAAMSTLQRKELNKSEESSVVSNGSDPTEETSPKQKKKGFFSTRDKSQKSLFKKLSRTKEHRVTEVPSEAPAVSGDSDGQLDDRHRRRFFSHHDVMSVAASLSVSTQLKTLERRNTTTGASAASAALRNGGDSEADQGDNISNELVLSCPYFRNEVGGETERSIALSRDTRDARPDTRDSRPDASHTPSWARGFSLLHVDQTYWTHGYCPYTKRQGNIIEKIDLGATYYKKHFYGQDHQNWFGIDDHLGAVAVSIRRERVASDEPDPGYMYRLIVRTSELLALRGCVLEDSIPALKAEKIKTIPTKEVLEFVCPELNHSSLHLGIQSGPCEDELIRLDEAYVQDKYKVGLMYCREGQQTEEDMYNNEDGGPAFNEFLDLIGQRVRLKGFNKYKAGLCNKNDSTGLYSVYREHENREIMFHVSTLLPYTPNNRQQLPRKRYIGNDIVTVVFQEPGARPFIPNIKSQFQHVFIVVRAHYPCSEKTQYSVAVTRSKSVPMFGPPLPAGATFPKSRAFADWLLTKIINAENAAHRSDKFVSMAVRTRQELLKELATNYVSQTTLESGSKFNLFGSKKKDKLRPRFSPDSTLRGALSWRVVAEDCSTRHELDAFIGISPDSIVIVQDNCHQDILFITATKSVLGWTALANSIRIYFHQGEAIVLHSKDWESDDMSEISQRLKAVTTGASTQEFTLRRNQLGQLGFHVQHDGLITEVENFGYAWQTGLRQGSRLVEICKHPVTALTHEQMVDLLKTSMTVTVTVIPPHPDGSPRRGCNLKNCSYAFGGCDGDYENVGGNEVSAEVKAGVRQQPSSGKQLRYSPSSNSSGYGTGSSRGQPVQPDPVVNGSSSSASHSGDERWYDFDNPSSEHSPPPLPNRIGGNKGAGTKSAFQKVTTSIYQHPPPPRIRNKLQENIYAKNTNQHQQALRTQTYNGYDKDKVYQQGDRYYNNQLEERRSGDAKVTYLTEYELNQPVQKDTYEQPARAAGPSAYEPPPENPQKDILHHERLTALKTSSLPPEMVTRGAKLSTYVVDAGHTTDSSSSNSSERVHRSEDELSGISASSSSLSPQRRRRRGGTPSSASSRNQSPRTTTEAKKKPVARNLNRNSANLGSSTLQEDLLKLISPEYTDKAEGDEKNRPSVLSSRPTPPRKTLSELSLMKSRSRENIACLDDTVSAEVSFHMARPATVISNPSSASSPALSEAKNNSKDDSFSPHGKKSVHSRHTPVNRVLSPPQQQTRPQQQRPQQQQPQQQQQPPQQPLPLPDSREMNWSSLVDTATKAAMLSQSEDDEEDERKTRKTSQISNKSTTPMLNNNIKTSTGTSSTGSSLTEVDQLVERVNELESRLETESRQKSDLEDEIALLREENIRLQEESHTAAQQLKRFTEWFFQTIDKT